MTDTEKLLLAGKAANYTLRGIERRTMVPQPGLPNGPTESVIQVQTPDGFWRDWKPLEDDGDAFRLASQLGMKIDFNGSVGHRRLKSEIAWTCTGPDAATTRQCIVYIAAQLANLPPEPKPEPIKMSDIEALQPRLSEIQAMVEQERQKRRDDIIRMASEAGAYIRSDEDDPIDGEDMDVFEFAALLAAAEREDVAKGRMALMGEAGRVQAEADAKSCEAVAAGLGNPTTPAEAANYCAKLIRSMKPEWRGFA